MLQLKNIDVIFNWGTVNETQVFDNFNLDIEKGQFVSVVGSNGSGKTTLLNLVAGNLEPTSGEILLEGKSILNLAEYERSHFIGRVFQDPGKGTSPSMTILENMALADNKGQTFGLQRGVNRKRLDFYRSQLEQLELGLEDKLNVKVGALSGGQRQALSLLICTLTPIQLLILDEHTAALDPKTSETIMELTNKLIQEKGLTTLMVTHNLRYAVEYGNRLLMMNKGEAVIDAQDAEKDKLEINDLVQVFSEISIELGN
ncbi:MAG: ATP-binding cassette domain-containing protein [Clostridia bacterium]|nr:ATP-binding cassette domain-containing protein [Clostridia bacterium]